jgi:hypothetical protein
VRSVVRVYPDPPLSALQEEQEVKGAIAQLGEHLLCKQGVVGSIPTGSTSKKAESKAVHYDFILMILVLRFTFNFRFRF